MTKPHENLGPPLVPLHGLLLSFPVALFPAALVSDIAYLRTAEIQWTNFSAWLIVGALVFGAITLVWALVDLLRRRGGPLYAVLLLAMCAAGLVNSFQHSRDGWSSVGTTGLILSIVSTLLALTAGWMAFSRPASRGIA